MDVDWVDFRDDIEGPLERFHGGVCGSETANSLARSGGIMLVVRTLPPPPPLPFGSDSGCLILGLRGREKFSTKVLSCRKSDWDALADNGPLDDATSLAKDRLESRGFDVTSLLA